MNDLRQVALRGNGKLSSVSSHPRVEPVYEHHPSRRRSGRGQEQGVIASRAKAADCAAGESAKAVGFEPLCVRIPTGRHNFLVLVGASFLEEVSRPFRSPGRGSFLPPRRKRRLDFVLLRDVRRTRRSLPPSAPAQPQAMATALSMPELAPVTMAFCPLRSGRTGQVGRTGSGKERVSSERDVWIAPIRREFRCFLTDGPFLQFALFTINRIVKCNCVVVML